MDKLLQRLLHAVKHSSHQLDSDGISVLKELLPILANTDQLSDAELDELDQIISASSYDFTGIDLSDFKGNASYINYSLIISGLCVFLIEKGAQFPPEDQEIFSRIFQGKPPAINAETAVQLARRVTFFSVHEIDINYRESLRNRRALGLDGRIQELESIDLKLNQSELYRKVGQLEARAHKAEQELETVDKRISGAKAAIETAAGMAATYRKDFLAQSKGYRVLALVAAGAGSLIFYFTVEIVFNSLQELTINPDFAKLDVFHFLLIAGSKIALLGLLSASIFYAFRLATTFLRTAMDARHRVGILDAMHGVNAVDMDARVRLELQVYGARRVFMGPTLPEEQVQAEPSDSLAKLLTTLTDLPKRQN